MYAASSLLKKLKQKLAERQHSPLQEKKLSSVKKQD
jgi:hypothetical protein